MGHENALQLDVGLVDDTAVDHANDALIGVVGQLTSEEGTARCPQPCRAGVRCVYLHRKCKSKENEDFNFWG